MGVKGFGAFLFFIWVFVENWSGS